MHFDRTPSGACSLRSSSSSFSVSAVGPVVARARGSAHGQRGAENAVEPAEQLLRPGERVEIELGRRASGGCRLSHVEGGIEVRPLDGVTLKIFGARVPWAVVKPPCVVEAGDVIVELSVAPGGDAGEDLAEPLPRLVGDSLPMRRLSSRVRRYAPLKLPVLVRGESGTGKDAVARALHDLSGRRRGPFVAINAATISRDLAESELFGHGRGAFTGAVTERRGAFREAHGGTLFIDEIAALGPEVQAKLLRVVEDGMVRPLGGEARHPVDVRLVVATCEPLEAMVEERGFRQDLYERLAVCVVVVPPLHERPEDIPSLSRHLLEATGLSCEVAPSALGLLMTQRFRGNVRELRNLLAQAALRTSGERIEAEHVQAVIEERGGVRKRVSPVEALHWLEICEGNISAAARRARVPRSTLRDLLRRTADGETAGSGQRDDERPRLSSGFG